MTPSIDAVSGLVEERVHELRATAKEFRPNWVTGVCERAADALEAQARELASLRGHHQEALSRIAALEDAVRVKDEALRAIHNCGQSAEPDHWKFRVMARDRARTALSNGEPK